MSKTSILGSLKLISMPAKASTDQIRRQKLLTRLQEQRALAVCFVDGTPFVAERKKVVVDDAGNKTTVTVPKRVKAWFRDVKGQVLLEVRYGNVPIELANGKTAIAVGDVKNLLPTLDAVVEAIDAGEFDDLLKKFDKTKTK